MVCGATVFSTALELLLPDTLIETTGATTFWLEPCALVVLGTVIEGMPP